jgi:hypothetical protein
VGYFPTQGMKIKLLVLEKIEQYISKYKKYKNKEFNGLRSSY